MYLGRSEGIFYHQGFDRLDDAKLKNGSSKQLANGSLAIGTSKKKKEDSVMMYSLCAVL